MASNASRTHRGENGKNVPPPQAKAQRKSRAALSLVGACDSGNPVASAPIFLQYEMTRLTELAASMCACDAASDLEFQMFFDRGAQPENTGLERQDIAARLLIAPITLQRWSRGDSLPFAMPRKSYLAALADLVSDHAARLQSHGITLLLQTPKRGARRGRSKKIHLP